MGEGLQSLAKGLLRPGEKMRLELESYENVKMSNMKQKSPRLDKERTKFRPR